MHYALPINRIKVAFLTKAIPLIFFIAALGCLDAKSFVQNVEHAPLILSNHDKTDNALGESVYELLGEAQSSILLISYTFTDQKLIAIINQKASDGISVQLIIDRDHIGNLKSLLHPSIMIGTRQKGEGHVHHKIMVVDHAYIWLGSANFTPSGLGGTKNLAIGYYSPEIAEKIHQEADCIQSQGVRQESSPLYSCYENQTVELYILPHNQPEHPSLVETRMNEIAQQKLISLFDNAQHQINVSITLLSFKDASRALIRAHQRGVIVKVITADLKQDALKLLINAGIPVKYVDMHHKFALIDNKILLNGSPNWSMNAFSRSDESFIVLTDLSAEQLAVMSSVWQSISGQSLDLAHISRSNRLLGCLKRINFSFSHFTANAFVFHDIFY